MYPILRKIDVDFVVVDVDCAHNIILGRSALEDLGSIISQEHLAMKFHTLIGVGVACCDQRAARDCYIWACQKIGEKDMLSTRSLKLLRRSSQLPDQSRQLNWRR